MHPLDRHRSQFRRLEVIDDSIEQESIQSLSRSHDFQKQLMEFMKEGVVVVSSQLNLIYLNLQAKQIYTMLGESLDRSEKLTNAIVNISRRFRESQEQNISIVECQLTSAQKIRIRACRLPDEWKGVLVEAPSDYPYLLIFLEDRSAGFQEDLKIEQIKYKLTEREVEIWQLLLQAYSYQEIANSLQISLNTVKFHAKNIYNKKRCSFEEDRVIYLDRQN
jgi:DNA-directed RNA polymerase specialized sigma24 family protein